jgi:hypothetical protein
MPADGAVRTVEPVRDDQVIMLAPTVAAAALAGIEVQLETAAFHLQQALEREARLRRRLERSGLTASTAAVDAAAARARAALDELAPGAPSAA